MNGEEQWQRTNENYLAAGLQWLRVCQQRQIVLSTGGLQPGTEEKFTWKWWPRGSGATKESELCTGARLEAAWGRATAALEEAEAVDPPPALVILAQRFGLSTFEKHLLLLCAALELDPGAAARCAQAQGDPLRPYPTFALAMTLFDQPSWDALSPERPLRYWRLIQVSQAGGQPLTASPLRVDERILNYIKGLNHLDEHLTPFLAPFEVSLAEDYLAPSQQQSAALITRLLQPENRKGAPPVFQLVGPDPLSQQLVAQQVAAGLNLHLNRMPVELMPSQATDLETLSRLWQREGFLLPVALFLDTHGVDQQAQAEAASPALLSPLHRFLTRSRGLFFLSCREPLPGLGPRVVTVAVDKPTPAEQQTVWSRLLKETEAGIAARLAAQFHLNLPAIHQVVQLAEAEKPAWGPPGEGSFERLWGACLANTSPRMSLLAERLISKATWDDLVLPEEALSLLKQIAQQVGQRLTVYDDWGFRTKMNRGLGISALFSGDSGTGKTMAAEVIAQELKLPLYRIDLSGVVSKYIGETEKNLRRLFDAAEDGGAILFFDEADALFGKRSEVKDSHDRYANIEINYLLQRIEAYRGLAILATNMKTALDPAFMRRLRFMVNFPFPGVRERKMIWQKIFPPQTPTAELDLEQLARLNLTGGSIQNVALNAAFLAAHRGAGVTMPLVIEAARAEFRKLEKPVNEAFLQRPASAAVVAD
jgi:hypothetical protein